MTFSHGGMHCRYIIHGGLPATRKFDNSLWLIPFDLDISGLFHIQHTILMHPLRFSEGLTRAQRGRLGIFAVHKGPDCFLAVKGIV